MCAEVPLSGLHKTEPSTPYPTIKQAPPTVTRTHLVEEDPGWLPGQLIGGLHHGFPCPPKEVSVGDIEERHLQVAFKLRQHVQNSLGDTRKGVLKSHPRATLGNGLPHIQLLKAQFPLGDCLSPQHLVLVEL